MLLGHLAADVGDPVLDVRGLRRPSPSTATRIARSSASGSSSAQGSEMSKPSRSRYPTRSRYAGHGRAGVAVERRAARRARCPGRRPTSSSSCAPGPAAIAAISRSSSADAPADTGAVPRIRPSSSAGGRPVQSPTCARKSPVGTTAAAVKRMCWEIISAWWSRQRVRYATSSSSESASGSTDCSSRCALIEAGLIVSSQSRSCSRQSFSCEDLLGALEALRDLVVGNRPHRLVREAVDVRHLERVDQHPVVAGEVAGAALERLRDAISVQ